MCLHECVLLNGMQPKNANRVLFTYYLKIRSYFKDHATVLEFMALKILLGLRGNYDI